MENIRIKAIIFADCQEEFNQDDSRVLKTNLNCMEYKEILDYETEEARIYKTYYWDFNENPLYRILSNRYRLPYNKYWNKVYSEEALSLDNYLEIEEIKMITYFEYEKEYIHSIINQQKSDEAKDISNSRDVNLVCRKLLTYLQNNNVNGLNENEIIDLNKLEILSSIANKYEKEIIFEHFAMLYT